MADLDAVRGPYEILKWAREQEAKLKEARTNAEDAIKAVLGDDEQGVLDGEIVVTWATHKKRQLQQKKLREAHPDIVEEFTELVQSRTFRVVGQ